MMKNSILYKIMLPLGVVAVMVSCGSKEKNEHPLAGLKWIDLTHTHDTNTLFWPNNERPYEHHTDAEGRTPAGYYYSSYSICTPEHGGTHLDAPIHFAEGKETVDQVPLSDLSGEAVIIDVSEKALANRDYLISVEDIENWEKKNGAIADSTIILFRTGYGKFYPKRLEYFGTDKIGPEAIPELHFPGIDPATTSWLLEKKKVKALGLDTPSMDYGQSKDFKTHQILLGANRPGFENVANLDLLPEKGVYIMALPMKIAKGSGAPLRIVATVF